MTVVEVLTVSRRNIGKRNVLSDKTAYIPIVETYSARELNRYETYINFFLDRNFAEEWLNSINF